MRLDALVSRAPARRRKSPSTPIWQGGLASLIPAELLLAALPGCIIKGIERITPMISFSSRGVVVKVDGVRQVAPPGIAIDGKLVYSGGVPGRQVDPRLAGVMCSQMAVRALQAIGRGRAL